ncbi:MAG: hypothetical protein ABI665_25745 [Vicinamibacterales bacterium]
MSVFRTDPGECIVCGAEHCACTVGGPIAITQMPARDAASVVATPLAMSTAAPLVADGVQATLPAGQVTTAHYRRGKNRKGSSL